MNDTSSSSEFYTERTNELIGAVGICNIKILRKKRYSTIYTAEVVGKKVVLKHIHYSEGGEARARAQLQHEFELLKSVNFHHIVSVWQIMDVPGIGECIVMEYVDGITLREWLHTKPRVLKRRRVLNELLETIDYLHRKQIVHGDLKPENILITHNEHHVKLIDFGLSDQDAYLLHTPGFTPGWAAPEQKENTYVGGCTDMYNIGQIISLLFPHRHPYIVSRCLRKEASMRYEDIVQLKHHLLLSYALPYIFAAVAAIAFFSIGHAKTVYISEASQDVTTPAHDYQGRRQAYVEPNKGREDFFQNEETPVPDVLRKSTKLTDDAIANFERTIGELPYSYQEFAHIEADKEIERHTEAFAQFNYITPEYEPELYMMYTYSHHRLCKETERLVQSMPSFRSEYAIGTISDSLFRVLMIQMDKE